MRTLCVMLPSAVMCARRARAKPNVTKASEFVFLILDRLAKANFHSLLSLKQRKQFVIDLIFIVKMQTKLTKAFGIMG